MAYKFLETVNFFELQRTQELLKKSGIKFKIENPHHFNITAGWVDPFCNNNERQIFVLEEDLESAKKILENNY